MDLMNPEEMINILNKKIESILNDKKIILLGSLKISLTKIIDSIGKDETKYQNPEPSNKGKSSNKEEPSKPQKVQEVHFQLIENELYTNPHLFDDNIYNEFFKIKNDIDTGVQKLPLEKESEEPIQKILNYIEAARKKRKSELFINKCFIFILIIGVISHLFLKVISKKFILIFFSLVIIKFILLLMIYFLYKHVYIKSGR